MKRLELLWETTATLDDVQKAEAVLTPAANGTDVYILKSRHYATDEAVDVRNIVEGLVSHAREHGLDIFIRLVPRKKKRV